MSISVYPKARDKRNGDEVEKEGISWNDRIYESYVQSVILIDKKQTEKVRFLSKNVQPTCDLGNGA